MSNAAYQNNIAESKTKKRQSWDSYNGNKKTFFVIKISKWIYAVNTIFDRILNSKYLILKKWLHLFLSFFKIRKMSFLIKIFLKINLNSRNKAPLCESGGWVTDFDITEFIEVHKFIWIPFIWIPETYYFDHTENWK